MKSYLLMTLFMSQLIYSQEISLEKLLKNIDKTSYQNEIYKIQNDGNNFKENFYKKGRYNGVKVEATTDYKDVEEKYSLQSTLSYGDFYITGEKTKTEDNQLTYGVQRSLKDLVLSKEDSELNKLNLNRDIDLIELKSGLETQKLNLITLYKSYKDNEAELKLKKNALITLEKEKKVLSKSYNLGAIPKIDLDSLLVSYKNIELEIQKIENVLDKTIERFYYDYGFKLAGVNLLDINPNKKDLNNYIEKVGEKELQKLKLEKNITEEKIKYSKYNNKVPELLVGVERNDENDENRVFLKFSKDIFYKDIDLSNDKNSLIIQEVTLKQKINETVATRYKVSDSYDTLEKDYSVLNNKASLEKSKYDIKKLENSLGKASYTEVMEAFDTLLELEVAKEKAKNSLNAYIYEIIVRGEI
ncbi:MAG: TolC family protein [Cetobacterium sp.]